MATDRVTGTVATPHKAPVPLREMFDVPTPSAQEMLLLPVKRRDGGGDAAQMGQGCIGARSFGVVADCCEEPGRGFGTDPVDGQQVRGGLGGENVRLGVVFVDVAGSAG